MNKLDPKVIWLFTIQNIIGTIFFFACIGFYLFIFLGAILANLFNAPLMLLIILGIFFVLLLFFISLSYFWAKLTYNNYMYQLTDVGVEIEKGVIFKRYTTIPYNKIQNVDIFRGVFVRMLNLSDVQIQTAGFSYSYRTTMFSEGRLPGLNVDTAKQLRDELIRRSTKN